METKSQSLIRQIKQLKANKKLSYSEILEELKENGIPTVSLASVRRVCADDSESKASSFNYEETLLPIYEAVSQLAGSSDDRQLEEIRVCLVKINEQIEKQMDELEQLIKRLIDRLDLKDEIIRQFISDMKQKDELIDRLMSKVL